MRRDSSPSVFEVYANEYDIITNARQREKPHAKEVAALIKRFKSESVLDAGCASGLTAALFAREGVAAVGLDRSEGMIAQAEKTRGDASLPLEFRRGEFESVPRDLHGRFDLVVCLANSISGVSTVAGLKKALGNFYRTLKPGGSLVLQMLNYASMTEGTLFPIKGTVNDGIIYQRFSERRGRRLHIYVTRMDTTVRPPKLEVFRHELDNFEVDTVIRQVRGAGFVKLHKFGNLLLTKRYSKSSRDLIILASRPK